LGKRWALLPKSVFAPRFELVGTTRGKNRGAPKQKVSSGKDELLFRRSRQAGRGGKEKKKKRKKRRLVGQRDEGDPVKKLLSTKKGGGERYFDAIKRWSQGGGEGVSCKQTTKSNIEERNQGEKYVEGGRKKSPL